MFLNHPLFTLLALDLVASACEPLHVNADDEDATPTEISSSAGGQSHTGNALSAAGASSLISSGTSTSTSSSSAQSTTSVEINFDELAPLTKVTDQYAPHALFSSVPTRAVYNYAPLLALLSRPMVITVQRDGDPGEYGLQADLVVDFPHGAWQLTFIMVGVNNREVFCAVDVTTPEGTSTVPLEGPLSARDPLYVDLTRFSHVTRIVVHDINDPQGVGYDDFHFQSGR